MIELSDCEQKLCVFLISCCLCRYVLGSFSLQCGLSVVSLEIINNSVKCLLCGLSEISTNMILILISIYIVKFYVQAKEAIPEFCEVLYLWVECCEQQICVFHPLFHLILGVVISVCVWQDLLQCLDHAYYKFSTWDCISETQVALVDVVLTWVVIWLRGMAALCAFRVAQSVHQLSFFIIFLFCNYFSNIDVVPTLVGCTRDLGCTLIFKPVSLLGLTLGSLGIWFCGFWVFCQELGCLASKGGASFGSFAGIASVHSLFPLNRL